MPTKTSVSVIFWLFLLCLFIKCTGVWWRLIYFAQLLTCPFNLDLIWNPLCSFLLNQGIYHYVDLAYFLESAVVVYSALQFGYVWILPNCRTIKFFVEAMERRSIKWLLNNTELSKITSTLARINLFFSSHGSAHRGSARHTHLGGWPPVSCSVNPVMFGM